jgi:hypothetical protein
VVKVFVASSYEELRAYREAVTRSILSSGYAPEDMLYWPAGDSEPLDVSLTRVRGCDLLVLLIAHHYGKPPHGHDKSVTELEFDEAVRCGIPVLAFSIDPNHPWLPKYLDEPEESRERLARFLGRVSEKVTRKYFTTPESLEVAITRALAAHERGHAATPDTGPTAETRARTGRVPEWPPAAGFSADVRDRYGPALAAAGLPAPGQWDEAAMDELRHACQAAFRLPDEARQAATTDLIEALAMAVRALPLVIQMGGREISIGKLRHLYRRHVGRWPGAVSREEMLILAASASIAERRRAASDPSYEPEPLTALARFMLGIAGQWKADGTAMDDPDLRGLTDWLTGPLMQQEEDVAQYLADRVGSRAWALVELSGRESGERTRPDAIVIDLIPERGKPETRRIPCAASEAAAGPAGGAAHAESTPGTPDSAASGDEAVLRALREAVSMLPETDVIVDLCLPRHWLDAGVEHWDVVEAGGVYESMSRHFNPRLRWAMHRHDPKLGKRLRDRFQAVDWSAAPEAIPATVTSDPASLRAWLDDRDQAGTRHPPYFCGTSPRGTGHDPLGALLREGYGFAVWFTTRPPAATTAADEAGAARAAARAADAADHACAQAASLAVDITEAHARRNDLPQFLAARLRAHRPAIIWSDPEGREDFPLPSPRGGGTRRGGAR